MLRDELLQMITLAERLIGAGEIGVLATLFSSSGSTYRPLGSMMVSGPAKMIAGGVSGGCLEEYVARQGRVIVQQRVADVLSFDTDPDGDTGGRPALGCGGAIEVLVERFTPDHLMFLREFYAARAGDHFRSAACVIEKSAANALKVRRFWFADAAGLDPHLERLRARSAAAGKSQYGVLSATQRALVYYAAPMTRLVIFGAGNDVRPVCALARSLGWHITVVDRRARLATPFRFPEADCVLAADWATAVSEIEFTPQTAVVMMTHSIPDDIEILPLLVEKPAAYIGVLGPEHRRQWLLEGVAETVTLSASFTERIRGPIGLNLGDRSAPGIAMSIIAEILAELNRCNAKPRSRGSLSVVSTSRAKALAANG